MMGSRRFRAELKRALPAWIDEGIIGEDGARTLEKQYRLDESGAGITVYAAYVLGALLVGGGIISLVAWNWDALSKLSKLTIIGSAMLTAEVGGYWLAEYESPKGLRFNTALGHSANQENITGSPAVGLQVDDQVFQQPAIVEGAAA